MSTERVGQVWEWWSEWGDKLFHTALIVRSENLEEMPSWKRHIGLVLVNDGGDVYTRDLTPGGLTEWFECGPWEKLDDRVRLT